MSQHGGLGAQRMGLWTGEDADSVKECTWQWGGEREHITMVSGEDYSLSPGKSEGEI